MARLFNLLLVCMLCLTTAVAQEPATKKAAEKKVSPSLAPITDVKGLPRVLLIGDSISMGYTLAVRELLNGKANVHRVPTNGGPTTRGLAEIERWIGDKPWDVIHFNWGLHDVKYMDTKGGRVDPTSGKVQVPIDEYERNLRQLTQRLKKTGAKLIWCSTTPVPEGSDGRIVGDEVKYNSVAAKVMAEEEVMTNDLYAFAKPQMDKIGLPANVHYSPEGYEVLAKQVASVIEKALPVKK